MRESTKAKVIFRPNKGRQSAFVSSNVYEVLWGGEAGGGKSQGLIFVPLRWVSVGDFRALLLRRKSVDLAPLQDKAQKVYPFFGGVFHKKDYLWSFPSGAVVRLGHCQHEDDKYRYQGDEFNLIGFDELTHFTASQYLELCSRVRTTNPSLPQMIRATTNPGGRGHDWVVNRWGLWLERDRHKVLGQATTSEEEMFLSEPKPVLGENKVAWFDGANWLRDCSLAVASQSDTIKGRSFLRSTRSECTQLAKGYEAILNQLDPVRRAQLGKGDFSVKPARGLVFKDLPVIPVLPSDVQAALSLGKLRSVLSVDLAASVDGDYTAMVHLVRYEDVIFVLSVDRFRLGPSETQARVEAKARLVSRLYQSAILFEQDPGQAGKTQINDYQKRLAGLEVRSVRPFDNKVVKAGATSAAASQGKVVLLSGSWVGDFVSEAESFPEGDYDDQVDALSFGFNWLFEGYEPGVFEGLPSFDRND